MKTRTQKTLTAAAVILLLILMASCTAVRVQESQFPTARQIWTSVRPLAVMGSVAVQGAEVEIVRLDEALIAGDRTALRVVQVETVERAANEGLRLRVLAGEISQGVSDYLASRNAIFVELLLKIRGEQ